jgi:hypothetical protein
MGLRCELRGSLERRCMADYSRGGLYGPAAATALEDLPYDARGILSGLYQVRRGGVASGWPVHKEIRAYGFVSKVMRSATCLQQCFIGHLCLRPLMAGEAFSGESGSTLESMECTVYLLTATRFGAGPPVLISKSGFYDHACLLQGLADFYPSRSHLPLVPPRNKPLLGHESRT